MDIEKAINYLINRDSVMDQIIQEVGVIKLPEPQSSFESLLSSIISQQISTKAAATIQQRIYETIDFEVVPERIVNTPPDVFKVAGLSRQKTTYVAALAEAFVESPHTYNNLHTLPNEEVLQLLTQIKGIGVWTAQMFMMFNLLREDIFPIGDLGIRRAIEKHYFQSEKQEYDLLIAQAEKWKPYRTVASFYLWRSLKNKD